jgi:hypothetical protein
MVFSMLDKLLNNVNFTLTTVHNLTMKVKVRVRMKV